jgi:SLIDE
MLLLLPVLLLLVTTATTATTIDAADSTVHINTYITASNTTAAATMYTNCFYHCCNNHYRYQLNIQQAKSEGNLPPVPEGGTLQLLPPDLCAEKALLISQGFSDWTKPHHQLFVRASAKYGRMSHDKIALEVGKSDVEVARYAAAFWSLGATSLSSTDWDRHVKNVERGEKRIEEINRLMDATRAFVSRFVNPWEQLAFQYCTTAQGKAFNAPEDRYLLCLAHQYGYGAWDQVKAAIRRSGRFKFDYFLRSCSADTLGKRCEALMRAAEKENAEWEKRAVAATTTGVSGSRPADSRGLKPGVSKEKAVEDEKRRVEESERIGKLREFVQRLGDDTYQLSDVRGAKQQRRLAELATAPPAIIPGHDGDAQQQQQQQPSSSQKGSKRESSTGAGPKLTSPRGGGAKKPSTLPDTVLPTLARIVHQAGPVGVEKLVTKFLFSHPEIAKRQVEKRINEISVKVKREGDARDSWYLKPEFLHYATGGSPLQGDAPDDGESQQQQQQQPKTAPKKRKAGAAASAAAAAAADDDAKGGGASGSARNPYSWFKEKSREKAVEELRNDGYDAPTAEQVKQKLKTMWNQLDDSVKDEYVELACKHGFNKKQKV